MKALFKTKKTEVLLLIVIYEVLFLLLLYLWPTFALKVATENLNKQNVSIEKLVNWHFAFLLFQKIKINEDVEIVNSIENYVNNVEEYNKKALIKLPGLNLDNIKQIEIKSLPETVITINPNLPLGEKIIPKVVNDNFLTYQIIEINGQQIFFPNTNFLDVNKQEAIVGTKNRITFADDIRREVKNAVAITSETSDRFILEESDKEKLRNTTIARVLINTEQFEDKIMIGSLQIFRDNCKSGQLLPIEYSLQQNVFKLSEPYSNDELDCLSFVEVDCEDCSLAPIDKNTRLPSTYVPSLVATNLPGGGLLTTQTVDALTNLSQALSSRGITLYVTSGYRSYEQQQVAYNSWVTSEINKGSNLEDAKIRANNYSALPGHSEHQLGTTVDVRCSGCDAFSKELNNSPFYLYLYDHAHEYGFVVSYPENKQDLTGYSFEPWHIRYIGVTMATELYNRGYLQDTNSEYLSKYLREKGLY